MNQRWWVLLAIGIGTFVTALDTSVVNTVLPVVRTSFQTNIANVEWVITIYLLVLSGLLLSFGRLGDMRGHKAIYMAGFGVFVGSSVLCGLAPSVGSLIAFRGLQALGAAMLAANSPAILTKSFPANQRGQALGLQATMTYLGLTVGPSFGGWLAEALGWPAVFYINVPIGAIALLLSWRAIPDDRASEVGETFDSRGALLFMAGLSALLLGLNQGHNWGWDSLPILGLLGGALLLLGAFLRVEKRSRFPMLDLELFKKRAFLWSTLSAVLNYIGVFSSIFLMPFYLIQGRGFTPAQAGLLLIAQPVVMAIVAPLSGTLSDRIGTRIPALVGMAILGMGLFLVSRLGAGSTNVQIMGSLAVIGLGTGIFISPNNSALMGAAPRQRQGIAAGILATARNLGMVLGVGLAGAIFTTLMAGDQADIYHATQMSFLAAAACAGLGVLTSAVRAGEKRG